MAQSSRDTTTRPGPLEVDPDVVGDEPQLPTTAHDSESETTSLASSIYKYRLENGRTYHAFNEEAAYFLPNDDRETARLDLQHNLCVLIQDNKLFLSPVGKDKPLGRVLDAGCGTGIWSMDFADEHPDAKIIGVDLSPIQPTFIPPNVEFFVDDLESDWTFAEPFDFVYVRLLTGSIRDWPRFMKQAFDNLSPGGWIELSDPSNPVLSDDGTLAKAPALTKWNALLLEGSVKLGASLDSAASYKQQLADVGFINIVKKDFVWPINSWPKDPKYKEIGTWVNANIAEGLEALSLMLFTNVLGWTAEDVKALIVNVRQEINRRDIHGYWPYYTVYAQKPE